MRACLQARTKKQVNFAMELQIFTINELEPVFIDKDNFSKSSHASPRK